MTIFCLLASQASARIHAMTGDADERPDLLRSAEPPYRERSRCIAFPKLHLFPDLVNGAESPDENVRPQPF